MVDTGPAPPHGRYKRGLDGASFSLQANTEDVPGDGRYYILQDGEVALATEDFQAATAEYNRMCREFWLERLQSDEPQIRIAAAWGLLGLDSTDKDAQAVIANDGSPQEKKRLDQAQSRRRAMRTRNAAKGGAAAAKAAPEAAAPAAPAAEAASEAAPAAS